MELHKEKNAGNNKKTYRKIISVSLMCLLIVSMVAIIVFYNKSYLIIPSQDINIDNDNILAVYQGSQAVSTVPAKGSGWIFDRAECTQNATATWDYKTWSMNIDNLTKTTKCTLYFVEKDYIVEHISNIVEGEDDTSIEVVDKGTGTDGCTYTLAYDGTADNNLRYVGKNPCNYVLYNKELWRIIGVMNNVEYDKNNSNQKETYVKLIKYKTLGSYSWDSSNGSVNANYGINQWGESTYTDETPYEGADIMRELNTDYLGNVTVGTDGKWFSANNNSKVAMPTVAINSSSKNMIQDVVWNTGILNDDNGTALAATNTNLLIPYIYERERNGEAIKNCTNATYCNDTVVRNYSWYGKVGLYSVSDYGYATAGGTTYNRTKCLGYRPGAWNSYGNCYQNNWLYDSTGIQWTMNSAVNATYATYAVYIHSNGQMYFNNAYSAYNIKPVIFLKSKVYINGGDGSSTNPYTIEYYE